MEKELPTLHVRMLGGERITYGGRSVLHQRNGMSRVKKLLMILLYNSPAGITRNKLIENLYGREEVLDGANNLRVACYRLKKMLVNSGLPEYEYIVVKDGLYYFAAPMDIQIDVHVFRGLIIGSGQETEQERKIEFLQEACEMYKGEFLEELSGDEWVLLEGIQYKNMYTSALQEVCSYLKEQRDYEEILRLCGMACEIYPLDEWQVLRIDCYIAMKRYKEAYKEYEDTAKLFLKSWASVHQSEC